MKIEPDLKREENFFERKFVYNKCLAKDFKLSTLLGGNPSKF